MSKRRRNKRDLNEYLADIETLSHEGRGIAHVDEKTAFIFNALPGEQVKFRYTKKRNKIAEGSSTEIIKASPQRIEPKCPNFTLCGGCSLQHIDGDFQRTFKRKVALELLENQGIAPETLLPTLQGPEWGYRRKARIGVKYVYKKEMMMVGFRERSSSLIANMNECHVLDPRLGFKIEAMKAWIGSLEARDKIPQLEIAATDERVALIIRHLEPLSESDLEAIKAFANKHQFDIYLQSKGIDTITLFVGESAELSYQLPEFNLNFKFLPFQFTQVNNDINQKMVSQALRLLDLQPDDTVLDLFCGIGNFTLAAATQAKHVTGVEVDRLAIDQANKNAALNNLSNVEFHVGNLFEDCHDLSWARRRYDKVLLDPPRSGAAEILPLIPIWQPQSIVYVSCNPSTFARDAAILKEQNYILVEFGTMDMFPHTQHTEVMGLFKKIV
ncbi:MAG: 23S rRNA (uracil(1939)-C(5))-methyltransferase RlmD [Mariprofundaceae bacterium]|nr:23S rRNA (uracil(1939)-C(5))-methyltransferase RlmD [Mariprofundaceae bacterium]